ASPARRRCRSGVQADRRRPTAGRLLATSSRQGGPTAMFCPQCGAAPTPGGRFCGNCGTLLPFASLAAVTVGGPSAPAPAGTPSPAPARRHETASRRSSLAFTLAVVACVVACGVVFTAVTSLLRSVADRADARPTATRD